ncbi:hypothetical protein ACHHYP_13783 [Achlya hypogyna]|uniref:Endonuclease/exonuclease/phosphatase domain-containing protein n=1 Tax=Achlya hypogyna TaxID=1202772 RepID=A0A1V9YEN9_ACHHY|nr:hypothetical protein ACHHYP_13783 [Achlya hypogyna]
MLVRGYIGDCAVYIHNIRLLDVLGSTPPPRDGRDELLVWMQHLDVLDAFRELYPSTRSYASPRRCHRLDMILLSSELLATYRVTASHDHLQTRSDHSACKMSLNTAAHAFTGPWKVPSWLIKYPEAAVLLDSLLDRFLAKATPSSDIGRLYDGMLFELRSRLHALHISRVAAADAPF